MILGFPSVWPRKDIFARRRCEDLLIPFSCTSTDIVQFEEKAGIRWKRLPLISCLCSTDPVSNFQQILCISSYQFQPSFWPLYNFVRD